MKNKGFTLIELLAVIVILAVISLIAVPMILGVIEDSRKSSFKVTCNEIYDSYEQYEVNEELQGSKKENVIFEFGSNRTEREEIDGTVYEPISKLNLKGELPKMGTYKILKDTRELVVSNDQYTCIRDGKRNEVLNGSIADNDITNPILKGISLSSTTNSIKVIADAEEPDGMIVKYYYKINGKETISESNNQVYTGLEKNKEYEIEVIVENKSGLKSETIKEKITTKEMNNPEIKQISETPGEYEYATSRVIQIGYDKQEGFQYYLKSSVETEVVGNIIVSTCGTEIIPGNCTESNVTTIEANTWYETSNTTPSVVYRQNGTLYALTGDGTNVSGISTYTVTKIDTENPNVEVSVTGKTATFTFSDNIGILSYGVNQSNTEEPSYIETNELTGNYEASSAGTYYVWVKDKAGNKINKTFEIDNSAFCAYNAGQTWNYDYTGGIQSFSTPCNGTYKLEVWGAEGGTYSYKPGTPGKGGYGTGYVILNKDRIIYIGVGGAGARNNTGGYNGGGRSNRCTGGGATHIGTRNGTLASYGNTSGLFIVAGGGGAAGWGDDSHDPGGGVLHLSFKAGDGGGSSGGAGYGVHYAGKGYDAGDGGTQSSGGQSASTVSYGTFGTGGYNRNNNNSPGGGGGLYGGGGGHWADDYAGGAGGGSGYIGGVTNGSMQSGARSGNGYARITLISAN